MKTIALAVTSLFTVVAPAAHAAYDKYGNWYDPAPREYRSVDYDRYHDTARVIASSPVYEAANGREECWNPRNGRFEERRGGDSSSGAKGAAIGALAGGVLGHQVDHGGGTAAGAIIGGLLGYQIDKNRNDDNPNADLDLSRCRVVAAGPKTLRGYDVRYSYGGQEYVARMDRNPGRRVVIGQDVNADGTPFVPAVAPQYSWR
jgi:uncharacterized protein YcfJ